MERNPFSQASTQRNRKRLNLLLNYRGEGTLLDMGCGDCGFISVANPHFQVEGIDLHPGPLPASGPDVTPRIVAANINCVELGSGHYDVITMFNLLEHLPDPYHVIQESYSGLKPGGILFGSVPNNRWIAGKIHTLVSNLFDSTHCSTFHPAKWLRYLRGAGFRTTRLLGEILLGRRGFYCSAPGIWETISFNFVFLCTKEPGPDQVLE